MLESPVASRERKVEIPAEGSILRGTLALPSHAVGLVLFAHGSGSGRANPCNRRVADDFQRALREMTATVALDVIPGATHLFEEPGTLDAATASAVRWFRKHLRSGGAAGAGGDEALP
jgi:hypothetical protein